MGGDPATAQTRSLMAERRGRSSSYVVDTSYIGRSRGASSPAASRRQEPAPGRPRRSPSRLRGACGRSAEHASLPAPRREPSVGRSGTESAAGSGARRITSPHPRDGTSRWQGGQLQVRARARNAVREPGTQWVPEVSKRAGRYGLTRQLDTPLSRDIARLERSPRDGRTAIVGKGSPVRGPAEGLADLQGFSHFVPHRLRRARNTRGTPPPRPGEG